MSVKGNMKNVYGLSTVFYNSSEEAFSPQALRKDITVIGDAYQASIPAIKKSIGALDAKVSNNRLGLLLNLAISAFLYFKLRKVEENANPEITRSENSEN